MSGPLWGGSVLASLAVTCLASIGARALRGFNRQGLVRAANERRDLLGDILLRHNAVGMGVESAQVLSTAATVLLAAFWVWEFAAQHPEGFGPGRRVAVVAVGIGALLAIEIWIPRVVVRIWGPSFLLRTWGFWKSVSSVLAPFTRLEQVIESRLLRWTGRDQDKPSDELFGEELRSIVSQGQQEGLLEEETREMIEGVIELGEVAVGDIMTPRTAMLIMPVDLPLDQVVQQAISGGHNRIPIYDKSPDDIVGVLYVRDLLPELVKPPEEARRTLRELLRAPAFVPETKPVDALLEEFQQKRVHMAVVLDEFGGVAGLVTLEDALEEIVGEIDDEYDDFEQGLKTIDPHTTECLARVPIREVNEHLKLNLPEQGDFETIGGLVFHEFGRIPKVGESVVCRNVRLTVIDVTRRKIERLRIETLDGAASNGANPSA